MKMMRMQRRNRVLEPSELAGSSESDTQARLDKDQEVRLVSSLVNDLSLRQETEFNRHERKLRAGIFQRDFNALADESPQ